MTTAVAIFVKTPGYSPVKTRLAKAIGAEAAVKFHCFAAAAVSEVVISEHDRDGTLQPFWAVAECDAMDVPLWRVLPRLWQGNGGLGDRLDRVYAMLQTAYERVLLIGADTPQVTPELLRQAGTALDDPATSFVIGDAEDGGFWLFGGRVPVPRDVWCSAGYSRDDTAVQLREALRLYGGIAPLPTLTDVDRPTDLATLADALAVLPAPLPAQLALRGWLERNPLQSDESFLPRRASMW